MAFDTPKTYIIQFEHNNEPQAYVLGTSSTAANSRVILKQLKGSGDDLTRWVLDPNDGSIILASTYGKENLYLTASEFADHAPLLIAPFSLGGRKQSWNWLSTPSRILCTHDSEYAIDNLGCKLEEKNKIVLFKKTGKCQHWLLVRVSSVQASLEAGAATA